ncbi:MAG: hypothetical protein JW867_06605 [Candidatus Omnitrophica bacterium]|nr:hypothetical protein [Candidatus Omnitrophota bacterium]
MKILAVYYSHHGNTSYVIHKLIVGLGNIGEVTHAKLDYKRGKKNLFKRILFKLVPTAVELVPVPDNLKDYDILCLGIPVLAGLPSSCVTKYLHICKNIKNKIVLCCYVYGFEANAKVCSRFVRDILERRGKPTIVEMFVPWVNIHIEEEVDKIVAKAIEDLKAVSPK